MDMERNKAALAAVRDRLNDTEVARREELSSLRNAKEEMRQALEGISRVLSASYTHPMELVSVVEGVFRRMKDSQGKADDQAQVLMKIFRMVKSTGGTWKHPDEVLAEVSSFIARNSKGQAEEFRQQLELETRENVRLRGLISTEEGKTAQANASARSFREECKIAQQAAQHWKVQASTTEAALRRLQSAEREDLAAAREKAAASEDKCSKLERRIEELEAQLSNAKRAQMSSALRALPKRVGETDPAGTVVIAVTAALRDAMEAIREKKLPTDNSARFMKRFNDGLELGASFVEAAAYSALPSRK